METVNPTQLPRVLHVTPRQGFWRVKWSDGKRALKRTSTERSAIQFARKQASGAYSVIVHTPEGYADEKRSILVHATVAGN